MPAVTPEYIFALYKARNRLADKFGGPVDLDLVEVLAQAIVDDDNDAIQLVYKVAQERHDHDE